MNAKVPEPIEEWLVVLRGDGTVDAVEGGAPVTWLGRALVETPDAPSLLRRAAKELVEAPPDAHVRRSKVWCVIRDREIPVELLVVEALPVRRAFTSVRDVVMRTLDLFASQARSCELELSAEVAEDLPDAILVDGEKLAWALSTLVGNALRYAKKVVRLRVRGRDRDGLPYLAFEVVDDGPGIPEKARRWLFERDPSTGKAVGVALLMVRDIVAAHRGTIEATSSAAWGTKLVIELPRGRARRAS